MGIATEARRSSSLALAAAVSFVAAIGALVWLSSEDDRERGELDVAAHAAAEAEFAAPHEIAIDSATADDEAESSAPSARETLADDDAIAAPDDAWAESPADGLEIVVVEMDTERLLAGATVLTLDPERLSEAEAAVFEQGGIDLDGMFERFGLRYRAGPDGRVRVARPDDDVMLLAGKTEEHWAIGIYEVGASEPFPLELEPDPTVLVRVVDSEGRTLPGVGVALHFWRRIDGAAEREISSDVLRYRTDGEGQVHVRHLRAVRTVIADEGDEGEFRVGLVGLLNEAVEVTIDEADDERVVELVAPDHGTIAIEAITSRGTAARGDFLLSASWTKSGDPSNATRREEFAALEAGTGAIVPVGLDLNVVLRLSTLQGAEVGTLALEGPRAPFETVQAIVEVLPPTAFTGRVVLARGALLDPVANETVTFRLTSSNGSRQEKKVRTDDLGRFRYEVDGEERGDSARLVARVELDDGAQMGAERFVGGRMDYGDNDLGDVVVEPVPVLFSGRVVSAAGDPVAGARVDVETRGPGEERFQRNWRLRTRSDADGSFAVHALEEEVAWIRLRARHDDYVPGDGVDVARGAVGVELVLVEGGLVLVGCDDPPVGEYRRHIGVVARSPTFERGLEFDEGAYSARVAAGTYTVEAWLKDGSEQLASFPDVSVRDGEVHHAGDLDLSALRWIRVLVTNASGTPLPGARVRRLAPYARVGTMLVDHTTDENGYATFASTEPSLDVSVHAGGHRTVRTSLSRSKEAVSLSAGIPVTIELLGERVRLTEGVRLVCGLTPTSAEDRSDGVDDGDVAIGAVDGRHARLAVAGPGSYTLSIRKSSMDGRDRGEPWQGYAPRIVRVGADGAHVEVEVTQRMAESIR